MTTERLVQKWLIRAWAAPGGYYRKAGNVSCTETLFYTYQTPMARRMPVRAGEDGILLNLTSYSSTSDRHLSALKSELRTMSAGDSGIYWVFTIWDLSRDTRLDDSFQDLDRWYRKQFHQASIELRDPTLSLAEVAAAEELLAKCARMQERLHRALKWEPDPLTVWQDDFSLTTGPLWLD